MFGRDKHKQRHLFIFLIVIAFLALAIFVAKQDSVKAAEKRDNRRRSHSVAILNAIQAYKTEKGSLPAAIDAEPKSVQVIGMGDNCNVPCGDMITNAECVDLGLQSYLLKMYVDPKKGTDEVTGYFVNKNGNGLVEVGSCWAEQAAKISVKR